MKLFRKYILLLALFSAIISIFAVINTFAKYVTSAQQMTDIPIARWNIKVNDTSIKNGDTLTNVITPIFPGSEHIAEGIIAPTAEGYFDLILDCTDADVSFSYNITISPNANSSVSDIVTTGYSIDNGDILQFNDVQNSITDNIYYSSGITNRAIRIYIKWNDNSQTENMDNAADTAATLDVTNGALLNVDLVFTQIADIPVTTP